MITIGSAVVGFSMGFIVYDLSFVFISGFQMSMFKIVVPMIGLGLIAIFTLIKESK
jgi:hypothetical protein